MELERQEKGAGRGSAGAYSGTGREAEGNAESEPSVGRQRISRVMKEEIAAETGETVQEVKVVLARCWAGQGICRRAIRSVDVRLVGGESENAEVDKRDDKEPISIEPVDSVQVNVESMQSERDGKAR